MLEGSFCISGQEISHQCIAKHMVIFAILFIHFYSILINIFRESLTLSNIFLSPFTSLPQNNITAYVLAFLFLSVITKVPITKIPFLVKQNPACDEKSCTHRDTQISEHNTVLKTYLTVTEILNINSRSEHVSPQSRSHLWMQSSEYSLNANSLQMH